MTRVASSSTLLIPLPWLTIHPRLFCPCVLLVNRSNQYWHPKCLSTNIASAARSLSAILAAFNGHQTFQQRLQVYIAFLGRRSSQFGGARAKWGSEQRFGGLPKQRSCYVRRFLSSVLRSGKAFYISRNRVSVGTTVRSRLATFCTFISTEVFWGGRLLWCTAFLRATPIYFYAACLGVLGTCCTNHLANSCGSSNVEIVVLIFLLWCCNRTCFIRCFRSSKDMGFGVRDQSDNQCHRNKAKLFNAASNSFDWNWYIVDSYQRRGFEAFCALWTAPRAPASTTGHAHGFDFPNLSSHREAPDHTWKEAWRGWVTSPYTQSCSSRKMD